MTQDLELRRKWTFRAHGKQVVFIKKARESDIHVLTKAFLWALYLPDYPDLSVEIPIGNRYKPDLVQVDDNREPVFWAEAGRVSQKKMQALVRRFRSTHLAFAKWNMDLEPFGRMLRRETGAIRRSAPVDLISIPDDSDDNFIRQDGRIHITFRDVTHIRLR
jgi:hypothetical protein